MTEYFVANDGDDNKDGLSEESAWQTISKVEAFSFEPGDFCRFKRGGVWIGSGDNLSAALKITRSGQVGNPITFSAYGIGINPIIENPGSITNGIVIDADNIIVENFLIRNVHNWGINIVNGRSSNIVRKNEMTDVGIGCGINGTHNLVTKNYIHDLHMVVDTPSPTDDDYGAVGIWIYSHENEISYNRMVNCMAPSQDYSYDGGAVEWFGDADRNYVHHNFAMGCNGFFEVGGGSCKDTIVSYNISLNNRVFGGFHLTGPFASDIENFRLENNVAVETAYEDMEYVMLWGGDIPESALVMRNNVIYMGNFWFFAEYGNFTHDHNIYHFTNPSTELCKFGGYTLGTGEMVEAPLFVDIANSDFHLQANSPGVDAGVDLGHPLDFDGNPVPAGTASDIGAYERQELEMPTRNVDAIMISNWQVTGQNVNIPQYQFDFEIYWTEHDGTKKQHSGTYRYPNDISQMPIKVRKRYAQEMIIATARVTLGIDEWERYE